MKTSILTLTIVLSVLAVGCSSLYPSASIPSSQKTPYIQNQVSADYQKTAAKNDVQVMSSVLEANTDSGTVLYTVHGGYVYDAEGKPVFDKLGKPLRVDTKMILKMNSLQNLKELSNVQDFTLEIGGRPHIGELQEQVRTIDRYPTALYIHVGGASNAGGVSNLPDIRRAEAEERAAILAGLANLAKARGEEFATKIEALSDGVLKIVTATGKEIVGRVTGTYAVETSVAGAKDVIGAIIQDKKGDTERVICEGDNCRYVK